MILKNKIEENINPVLTKTSGTLILEYKQLLEVIWLQDKARSIQPSGIKKTIKNVSKTFAGYA